MAPMARSVYLLTTTSNSVRSENRTEKQLTVTALIAVREFCGQLQPTGSAHLAVEQARHNTTA